MKELETLKEANLLSELLLVGPHDLLGKLGTYAKVLLKPVWDVEERPAREVTLGLGAGLRSSTRLSLPGAASALGQRLSWRDAATDNVLGLVQMAEEVKWRLQVRVGLPRLGCWDVRVGAISQRLVE